MNTNILASCFVFLNSLMRSMRLVGERSVCSEAGGVNPGGADRSENAGMSSDSSVRNRAAENPRFPPQCKSAEG